MRIKQTPGAQDAHRECGAALLIVLATLVLVVTACATLAQFAGTVHAQRVVDRRTAVADDLLAQAGTSIAAWLEAESTAVALPSVTRTGGVASM